MNKKILAGAVIAALSGLVQVFAASYDPATHLITLNNVQGLNKNSSTFNTAVNLQAADTQALHKGQIYKIAGTSVAIGNPDARYTIEESKLFIPNLVQDASTMESATLQLTNPTTGELTVLEVIATNPSTQGGIKGDTGPQGPKGDTGLQGPAGANGKDGTSSSLAAGTKAGDMQYWDGSKWTIVSAGTNGAYLVFCDGKPLWGTCKTTPTPAPAAGYKIGDTGPAGGIVFFVDSTFMHGLKAQAADYNQHQRLAWAAANTIATTNYGDGWRLPTKDELNTLYQFKTNVGGFVSGGNVDELSYWSSTEFDSSSAWIQNFTTSGQYYAPKTNRNLVRAVKSL